ncbi:hypothetical protein [Streptomyces sp. NBC_00212]|uniref:hypothetical protein n=1 Tax=Streptomyces sp. NBC_00212 TaxID=2975684 RepID=UPI00324D2E57
MTAEQYRRRAVELLTQRHELGQRRDFQVREADVWARLAQSAAISEQTQAVRDADQ